MLGSSGAFVFFVLGLGLEVFGLDALTSAQKTGRYHASDACYLLGWSCVAGTVGAGAVWLLGEVSKWLT